MTSGHARTTAGDPAAITEAAGFNTAVTHRPAVVVAADSAEDVAAAVRLAGDEGLPVAVQATGHGAAAPAEGGAGLDQADAGRRGSTRSPGSRGSRPGSAGGA